MCHEVLFKSTDFVVRRYRNRQDCRMRCAVEVKKQDEGETAVGEVDMMDLLGRKHGAFPFPSFAPCWNRLPGHLR